MSKQKKRRAVGVMAVLFVILALAVGETLHMDSRNRNRLELEKQTAIEIKAKFKNIKKITMTDFYESSPGIKNVFFDIEETNGHVIRNNSTIIGSYDFRSDKGLTVGSTDGKVKVIYTTGEEDIIE